MNKLPISIFWFRRDLRLEDNCGLFFALTNSKTPVLPIFIFDSNILKDLTNKRDPRVLFIYQEISKLKNELEKIGSSLKIFYDTPENSFKNLLKEYQIDSVFLNDDYEPYARKRDSLISNLLKEKNINFNVSKDHVIFAKDEIVKDDKLPYVVFTAYANKWKKNLRDENLKYYPSEKYKNNFLLCSSFKLPNLEEMGFENFNFAFFPEKKIDLKIVNNYNQDRDFPSINGTTHLGVHLRFGTISNRQLCKVANITSERLLDEIIWRDFYQMIIYHFPHCVDRSFKPQYDKINWIDDEENFKKWCEGKTGYPIVDAGMRELNQTGFMHNRSRMITASFLTKHLLIDWRLGEKYFAEKLLDYELASNVGGWQWVVGSGCDAAPYFRIFNPSNQLERFDPEEKYIKKWIPNFKKDSYLKPIVDHKFARKRCLEVFAISLGKSMFS